MGDQVKRLRLVDNERFNKLLSTLEQVAKRKKIVDIAKTSREEAEFVDSYNDMLKSVKNKSGQAGTDIVNFMRKKDKFKGALAAAAAPTPPPAAQAEDEAGPSGKQPAQGSVASAHQLISGYLKRNGVVKTAKGIKAGGKSVNVPYEYLLANLRFETRPFWNGTGSVRAIANPKSACAYNYTTCQVYFTTWETVFRSCKQNVSKGNPFYCILHFKRADN